VFLHCLKGLAYFEKESAIPASAHYFGAIARRSGAKISRKPAVSALREFALVM
jgi:hypothetical protein